MIPLGYQLIPPATPSIDQETAKKFFEQMMSLFVLPEIEERRKRGVWDDRCLLNGIQIVFYPDGRPPLVKFDDEIVAKVDIKLKDGVQKKTGEMVRRGEIEELGLVSLVDPNEADCGHATMIRTGEQSWSISFDFVYNKQFSIQHLEKAEEYLQSAEDNLAKERWSPFIDNLFSACELVAKAILLGLPDSDFRKKAGHQLIQMRYNTFADFGNVTDETRQTLNKLSGMRNPARYLKGGRFEISKEEAEKYLRVVKDMKTDATRRIGR